MRTLPALSALATTLVSLGTASAATTVYTDRTAFLAAAVTPATTIDFEGTAPTGGTTNIYGQTFSGVTFSDWWGYASVIDPAYYPSYYDWGTGQSVITYYYGDPIFAGPPAGTRAFGADLGAVEYYTGATPQAMDIIVTFADNSQYTYSFTTQARPNLTFVGFISDQDITDVSFATPDISNLGYYPFALVDNVTYALCDGVDADGVCDTQDNCVGVWNPSQADSDSDGLGDACDTVCLNYQRGVGSDVNDAWVNNAQPTTNFGAATTLYTGSVSGSTRRSYLQWDVSSIPATAVIQSATLTLYQLGSLGAANFNVFRSSGTWTETGLLWGNQPVWSPVAVATKTVLGAPTNIPVSFDLTGLVQQWVSGTYNNRGIMVQQGGGNATFFGASEASTASHRPMVDVCYVIPG